MRTRVLLIIKIYYLTFILVTSFSMLFLGTNNLVILSQTPLLFLFHGNITDVILYLIIFSDSFLAIYYITLSRIYVQYRCLVVFTLNNFNSTTVKEFIQKTLSNIFHPPKYLSIN